MSSPMACPQSLSTTDRLVQIFEHCEREKAVSCRYRQRLIRGGRPSPASIQCSAIWERRNVIAGREPWAPLLRAKCRPTTTSPQVSISRLEV